MDNFIPEVLLLNIKIEQIFLFLISKDMYYFLKVPLNIASSRNK